MSVGAQVIVVATALAFGLLLMVVSSATRRARRESYRGRNRYALSAQERLEMWAGPRERYKPADWDAAIQADATFTGWLIIMSLLVIGLGIAAYLAVMGLWVPRQTIPLAPFIWLGMEALACVIMLATDLTYFISTSKTRASHASRGYTLPEGRNVGDFVSPWCWIVWSALITLTAGAYQVFASSDLAVPISLPGYSHIWSRFEIGGLSLLASVFTLLLAGFSAQGVASARAVEGEAGDLFAAMNDFHRATVIGAIVAVPFLACAMILLMLIPGIASNNLAFGLLFFIIAPFAARLPTTRGRLGGRLTGWWWQPRPAPIEQGMAEGV